MQHIPTEEEIRELFYEQFEKNGWWRTSDDDAEGKDALPEDVLKFFLKIRRDALATVWEKVEAYHVFAPDCGYDSEEEKGFQKGLTSGENLFKNDILDFLDRLLEKED